MNTNRYRGALLAFIAVLLAFLVTGALLVTSQQEALLTGMFRHQTEAELDLMGDAFYEALLKSDYVTIRTFVQRWGEAHREFVSVRAISPNGYTVGEFERPQPTQARTFALSKVLRRDGTTLLTIELVTDLSSTDTAVLRLRNRMLAGAMLFTALLGAVLWRSQRIMALAPLEREIRLREEAEQEIRRAHDELEVKVQERTVELRRREEHIRLLLESTAEGIYGIDTTGVFTFVNPAALRMLGYAREEDLLGKNSHTSIHHRRRDSSPYPEQDCRIYNAYRSGTGCHVTDEVFWRADGTSFPVEYWSFPVESEGRPVGAVVTFLDRTDQERLEAQLLQSQKMEAIGTLAGGVAHDFNNILTAIIGYGSILQRKMDSADPLRASVANILESAQRAARLTRSLLTFSRKQIMTPGPVDVNSIIRRIEKLLVPLIGEDVELAIALSDADLIVLADSGQIEQVLMNLAANARDAMPRGGILTIRTELARFDAEQAHVHGLRRPGEYAVLSVSDTGVGMDEQTRQKIFDPFFTTKEVGRGTGLGLSIAYGIIQQHSGVISVYSEPGKGTSFKICLPVLGRPAAEAPQTNGSDTAVGGTETILIAEDEPSVLALLTTLLEERGYRVLTAPDGEEAVRVFAAHRDAVQLVILDTIMPKKNGRATFEAIRALRPDIRVLFMSGYTADIVNRQGLIDQGFELMQKPIAPVDLLLQVRKALTD